MAISTGDWRTAVGKMSCWLAHYGRREHCEAFFKDGSIQIGTLRSYDVETHGSQIGDDLDGLSFTTVASPTGLMPPPQGAHVPFSEWLDAPGSSGNVFLVQNIAFNYAIFCTSSYFSKKLCKEFSPKYDAAIVIERPSPFFHELTNAMVDSGLFDEVVFQTLDSIQYRNLDVPHGQETNEALTKRIEYANQSEVRALWSNGTLKEKFYRFPAPLARRTCHLALFEDMPDE